ncbi:hypothetical protein BKA83DRAFT_3002250 [Pisolithus microcarpus]|nr:hypothetical protein BKA83DRAFT_3002250 [Pisolithus microcarpus]
MSFFITAGLWHPQLGHGVGLACMALALVATLSVSEYSTCASHTPSGSRSLALQLDSFATAAFSFALPFESLDSSFSLASFSLFIQQSHDMWSYLPQL